MSKSYKINGDLIKSAGNKLQAVGLLMSGNIVVFILYLLFISNSDGFLFISSSGSLQTAGNITAGFSLIISILVIWNIIQCGGDFINSIEKGELEESNDIQNKD